MQIEVTRRGAEIPKTSDTAALVRKDLIVVPFAPSDPYPKRLQVYAETPTKYIVPLHWARQSFPDAKWNDTRGPGKNIACSFVGSLLPDLKQPEAVHDVMASLQQCQGAMLCQHAGGGKTSMALYIAAQVKKKTLVIVHKQFLADQWKARIQQFLPGTSVSVVQGDKSDVSGDIVIAMVQTLVNRDYGRNAPTMFDDVGLLITDEAHHWAAPTLCKSMIGLCAPYSLALTATPERRDKLERVVNWLLGPIAFYNKREDTGLTTVRIVEYSCPAFSSPPPSTDRGTVDYTAVISALVNDYQRTRLVAAEAVALAADRDVLVLSNRREHCKTLQALIEQHGVECATYLGGDKEVPTARVIVATFSLTSEGFDCPRLSALVLATPANSVEQACGRVMRGSSKAATIVDVVDAWNICRKQAYNRKKFYLASGFRIEFPNSAPVTPAEQPFRFITEDA